MVCLGLEPEATHRRWSMDGADTSKELKQGLFSVPHIFIFLKNAFDDSMTFGTDTASTYETDINSINAVTNE